MESTPLDNLTYIYSIMKVIAKRNFAFKGKKYIAGDVFNADKDAYEIIASDVSIFVEKKVTKKKKAAKPKNKQIKQSRNK